MLWLLMAVLSALFGGLTSVLAKSGIQKTDSDIATAIRTAVVLIFSWIMVFIVGSYDEISDISSRSLLYLVLSGSATGASWICYFKALSLGDVNKVVPIDKSSTVLTVLLAIIIFRETNNLPVKLFCTVLLSVGIFMMIDRSRSEMSNADGRWFPYALASAVFAALTAILAKIGIDGVESNLGTAVRTAVVLIMAWVVVFIKGKQNMAKHIDRKELRFIILSGIATGASWLCYYYAIKNGIVSIVVPVDKLSIAVSVVFSSYFFKEKLSRRALYGLMIMIAATAAMALFT